MEYEVVTARVPRHMVDFVRELLKQVAMEPSDFEPVVSVASVCKFGKSGHEDRYLTSCSVMSVPSASYRTVYECHGYLAGFVLGTAGCAIEKNLPATLRQCAGMRMDAARLVGCIRAVEALGETKKGDG